MNHREMYRSMAILGVDADLATRPEVLESLCKDVLAEVEGQSPAEEVLTPVPIERAAMARVTRKLEEIGYTLRGCASRLGVDPWGGVKWYGPLRPTWGPAPDQPLDLLVSLLLDEARVDVDRAARVLSGSVVDSLLAMSLVKRDGDHLHMNLRLFPCYAGTYIVTDAPRKRRLANNVMFLWGESYVLGGVVARKPRRAALDLCTGSGIHAILAGKHCKEVKAVDINERAVRIASFNKALNGADNVEILRGDLYEPVEGSTFDLILANPPYNPETASAAGDNFWAGGATGDELLARVVKGLPRALAEGGMCHVISLFPNPPGTTTEEALARWLGAERSTLDVLDHSASAFWFVNPYVARAPQLDTSAFRFGLLNLRRGTGAYHLRDDREPAFSAEGACEIVFDDAAFDAAAARRGASA